MRRIPTEKQTHFSLEGFTIGGHKILICAKNPSLVKTPMNCNSANRTYMIASVDDRTTEVKISSIAIYEGHHISRSIDLVFDSNGDIIPYSNGGKGTSHGHQWFELRPGIWGRNARDKTNHLPYTLDVRMANQIVAFNNRHYHYEEVKRHPKS